MIFKLAERLAADREDFKSADALLKLAKMQGWVGAEPDTLWKTFSALSQADIDEVRKRLKENQQAQLAEAQQPDRGPTLDNGPAAKHVIEVYNQSDH